QHDAGLSAGNLELDPALPFAHRAVGQHAQADLLGPELEGAFLIARGNADELDGADGTRHRGARHEGPPRSESGGLDDAQVLSRRPEKSCCRNHCYSSNVYSMLRRLRLDDYVCDVLMRDLVGHDQQPSAFLVYLCLTRLAGGGRRPRTRASL